MKTSHNRRPLLDWTRRYLPAEIVSTACAILAAWTACQMTGQTLLAALAYTAGGSVSFYAVILACALWGRGVGELPGAARDLVLEFGPAEALDTLLLRPALLVAGVSLVSNPALGMLVGKLAADLCFYVPAIVSYELLRHARSDAGLAKEATRAPNTRAAGQRQIVAGVR